jgi:amino acid permease
LTFSSVFFGNPLIIFERIVIASRMMGIQDPAYRIENILRFDAFPFSWRLLALLFVFTAFLASVVVLSKKSSLRYRFLLFSTLILLILLVLYLFIANLSSIKSILNFYKFQKRF